MREAIKIINTETGTIDSLRSFLISKPNYFIDGFNDCHSIHDVIHFRIRNPERVMFVGDQFMCDIYAGEMWIIELLDKPIYDKTRKQKLHMKPIVKVVENCGDYFPRYNGYWLIPESFIRKEKVTD